MWRFLHHDSEKSEIPLSSPGIVPTCSLQFFPQSLSSSSRLLPYKKRVQTCIRGCFYLKVSVLFHQLSHVRLGKQHSIVCCSFTAEGMFLRPAECNCTAHKRVSHSACWALKVDPRQHISVGQMNHQKGVAACGPPAPAAQVSPPSSRWCSSKTSYYYYYSECNVTYIY